MNKQSICNLLEKIYSITAPLTLIMYLWLLPDIKSVETDSFDFIKWLDADIFLINNVLTPLLVITLVAIILKTIINFFSSKI